MLGLPTGASPFTWIDTEMHQVCDTRLCLPTISREAPPVTCCPVNLKVSTAAFPSLCPLKWSMTLLLLGCLDWFSVHRSSSQQWVTWEFCPHLQIKGYSLDMQFGEELGWICLYPFLFIVQLHWFITPFVHWTPCCCWVTKSCGTPWHEACYYVLSQHCAVGLFKSTSFIKWSESNIDVSIPNMGFFLFQDLFNRGRLVATSFGSIKDLLRKEV